MKLMVFPLERARDVLGRVTMYRLVTVLLFALVLVAFGCAAIGQLEPTIFRPSAMAATLVVLLGVSLAGDLVLGRVVGARVHLESALITALLLWFLYWPTSDARSLAWLGAIAFLAQLSKFVIVFRGRHVVNPAAAGVVVSIVLAWWWPQWGIPHTTWWVANSAMVWFVAWAAFLVLWRTGRLPMAAVFVLLAGTWTVQSLHGLGMSWSDGLSFAWRSSPIVFFAGFMLSEPLTLPPRRRQKVIAAVLAALVFTWPLVSTHLFGQVHAVWMFENTFEVALVITGVFAVVCRQQAATLELIERRDLGGEYAEYRYRASRRVSFAPGQYAEIHVPHRADARGQRRMLSFVSIPGDEIAFAVREPQPGSSLKRALPGMQRLRLTSVHGDFTWSRRVDRPLLLVAGGIGITPFVSQIRAFGDSLERRDIVVVHGVHDVAVVPYLQEFETRGIPVHVVDDVELTAARIGEIVPDLDRRVVFVSGSPAMVDALAPHLSVAARRVHTDSFLGS